MTANPAVTIPVYIDMEFVDEDDPQYDESNLPGENPFTISSPADLDPSQQRSPSEVAQYTAQWLEQGGGSEENSESSSKKDSEEEEKQSEGEEEQRVEMEYQKETIGEFVVHHREESHEAISVPIKPSNSVKASIKPVESQSEDVKSPIEDTGEEIFHDSPYLTRTSHSGAGKISVLQSFPAVSDPTQDLDEMVRAYQASMTGRVDVSSGNFQTARPTLDVDESELPSLDFPVLNQFLVPTDAQDSSKSSERDPFEHEVDLVEEEMDKVETPTDEQIERISIRLQVPIAKARLSSEEDSKRREIKARISIKPSEKPREVAILRTSRAVLSEEMSDIRQFLTTPLHPDLHLQCIITRVRSGFKRFFPVYILTLESSSSFLLAAKKRPNNKTSNYLISMSESDLKKTSAFFLGKLRSNFLGTEYNIYDQGLNPKRKKATGSNIRQQLGTVLYVRRLPSTPKRKSHRRKSQCCFPPSVPVAQCLLGSPKA